MVTMTEKDIQADIEIYLNDMQQEIGMLKHENHLGSGKCVAARVSRIQHKLKAIGTVNKERFI